MKRRFFITTIIITTLLAGCSQNVADSEYQSTSSDAVIETTITTETEIVTYDFAEVYISQRVLPVEEYYDLYFDMNQFLDARFELENELLTASHLNDKEVYTVKEPVEEHAKTYWRVEIDGAPVTWQYYEDRAKQIYTDDYVNNIFNPYYIENNAILFKEVDDMLYRIMADTWTHRMDRDSMQIARYGDNYLVWGYVYYFEDLRDTVLYYVKPAPDKQYGLEIEMRTVISAD